jgi:hypothetical protein
MPSVDRVGRHFPLTVARPLQPLAAALGARGWYDALDVAARRVLDLDYTLHDFEQALAELAVLAGRPARRGGAAARRRSGRRRRGPHGLVVRRCRQPVGLPGLRLAAAALGAGGDAGEPPMICRFVALAWALLVLLAAPALAERMRGATITEERIALVIGNAAYRSDPLDNPVNDARLIAQSLKQAGFTVALQENLDRASLLNALRDFGNSSARTRSRCCTTRATGCSCATATT